MRLGTKNRSTQASSADGASHPMIWVLQPRKEDEEANSQGQTNWPPREGNPCLLSPCCRGITHMASIQRNHCMKKIVLTHHQVDGGE
jgi:hypothetical protein